MGERGKRKRKMARYEELGDSSEGSAGRTRASTTWSLGGQNPSLPPLDPLDDRIRAWPAAQGGGDEGDRTGPQTLDLISQLDRPTDTLQLQEGDDTMDPGTLMPPPKESVSAIAGQPELPRNAASAGTLTPLPKAPASATGTSGSGDPQPRLNVASAGTVMPPPRTATPSSPSRMNFALNSTRQRRYVTGGQLAAAMARLPRPPQAQRSRRDRVGIGPSFPRMHASGSLPKGPSMRVPSGGAQGGGTSRDGARGRGVQSQAPPPLTAGQRRAATVPSGSGQPQAQTNAGAVVDPRQHQSHSHPPPDQQGLAPARTNHMALVAMQCYCAVGQRHLAQVPEHQRCRGCLYSRRPLVMHPRAGLHYCLCYFCLLGGGLVCAICAFG